MNPKVHPQKVKCHNIKGVYYWSKETKDNTDQSVPPVCNVCIIKLQYQMPYKSFFPSANDFIFLSNMAHVQMYTKI